MELKSRAIAVGEFLNGASFEEHSCNLCGKNDYVQLSDRDGLNVPVRTVMCANCGLVSMNPRLTKDWYGRYYAVVGQMRSTYKHGVENPKERLGAGFGAARRHGAALARHLRPHVNGGVTIDVGSAEGGLLAGFADVLSIQPIGIEPTVARAEYATAQGIKTYAGLIEDVQTLAPNLPQAANIVCTKSLNHFLDPQFFFRWTHRMLEPGGRLVLEVKNFRQQVRMSGRIRYGIQIDHPFMFVPETLELFVRAAGFEILAVEVDEEKSRVQRTRQKAEGLPIGHIRLVARKTSATPFAEAVKQNPDIVRRLIRELSAPALYLYYLVHYATPWQNLKRRLAGT